MSNNNKSLDKVISLIFATGRIIREEMAEGGKISHLSHLQIQTLKYISEHQNLKMKEVAKHLCITGASATVLIGRLIKSGQIKKIVDANDRRVFRLTITDSGRIALQSAMKVKSEHLKKILSGLSSDDIKNLTKILAKISHKQ